MKYAKYFGILMLMLCFSLLGPGALAAQETRTIYLVRQIGQNDVWTMNMGIQTEALRLYVPAAFERKGKTVNLQSDTPRVSFSSGRETIMVRAGNGILVRYDVSVTGVAPLPKADRTATIRFTLAELEASATVDAEMPASYALRKAILNGPYTRGQAWVQSIDYADNRFTVIVGFRR